jgi:polyisoprenoid-binding protein YceI
MSIAPGTHRLGPDNATLTVRTARGGAAARAGHDLTIHVTAWQASLAVGDDAVPSAMELTADATSLRVHEGTGGMQPLGDDQKASIHQTIDEKILRREDIVFRSTGVQRGADDSHLRVEGELTLAGASRPIAFELAVADDGTIGASAVVTQTAWGLKPYSALFGALKVADDVDVVLDGHL